MIFALDLEGCLAPEIWPVLGAHFGLPEFNFTTRDGLLPAAKAFPGQKIGT